MLNILEENGIGDGEAYFPKENKLFAFGEYEVSTLAIMQDEFKIYRKI